MNKIKNIGLMIMLALFAFSCVEKEPDYQEFAGKDADFTFHVVGNEYQRDFYYVSTLQFTNTSAKTGTIAWDFDDGTTSTEPNPTHKFEQPGEYKVTLKVAANDGTTYVCTYPILIMDIAPTLSVVEQTSDTVVINDVVVTTGVELPNPDNLKCKFTWILPEGTMDAEGNLLPATMELYSDETGAIPTPGPMKFKNVGSQKIEVQTVFDFGDEAEGHANKVLSSSYLNVQVGYTEEVPTLYYASYGGNIKAYKLIPEGTLPADTKNLPFDMGVSSGVTPQQILFASTDGGDFIYILDCGKNFCYQNDTDGVLGDGKITVMSADGTYANTMITNVGGHAFSDPFSGCVHGENLLYNDRNTGFNSIALSTRGAVETRINSSTDSYFCSNQSLGYYGRGIAYGAVHTGLAVDKSGVYWWPKCYNATGIYRFKPEHIGSTDVAPTEILLNGATCKAFALDETRKHMYCWLTSGAVGAGFAQYPLVAFEEGLAAGQYTKYIKHDAAVTAGTASSFEALYVSQFAIDDANGNVYFGFNAADGETLTTGVKYFDYATGTIKSLEGNTDKAFGICINPRKTKLF